MTPLGDAIFCRGVRHSGLVFNTFTYKIRLKVSRGELAAIVRSKNLDLLAQFTLNQVCMGTGFLLENSCIMPMKNAMH